MRFTKTAILEENEIKLLKEVASIECSDMLCCQCPLGVERSDGRKDCVRELTKLCLKQNHINPTELYKQK